MRCTPLTSSGMSGSKNRMLSLLSKHKLTLYRWGSKTGTITNTTLSAWIDPLLSQHSSAALHFERKDDIAASYARSSGTTPPCSILHIQVRKGKQRAERKWCLNNSPNVHPASLALCIHELYLETKMAVLVLRPKPSCSFGILSGCGCCHRCLHDFQNCWGQETQMYLMRLLVFVVYATGDAIVVIVIVVAEMVVEVMKKYVPELVVLASGFMWRFVVNLLTGTKIARLCPGQQS